MVTLRAARSDDLPRIRGLIRQVGINPLGLKWRRFTVAEQDGEFVGCMQLKPHRDGSLELASLAVVPERQGQGVGGQLIAHCLAKHAGELHLMCGHALRSYYARHGFEALRVHQMPPYFRRIYRAAGLLTSVTGRRIRLAVMRRKR